MKLKERREMDKLQQELVEDFDEAAEEINLKL